MRGVLVVCSAMCLMHASIARAQGQPPKPPKQPAAPAAADEADDEGESTKKPAPKSKAEEIPEEPPASTEAPPPVLPPARADEQQPGPFVAPREPSVRERKLEIGPDFGVTARPADSDDISYLPGFTWGVHARVEVVSFLGVRAYFNNTSHAVDIPTGALGPTSDTRVDQEDVSVMIIGGRLEPTWVVTPELRLWVGAGIAWGRVFAEEPTTRPAVASSDRSGVMLELSGSLGASYDLIPRWFCVSLLLSGGLPTNHSGDVFDKQQVINQAGLVDHMQGLPKFDSTFSALVGLGLIL